MKLDTPKTLAFASFVFACSSAPAFGQAFVRPAAMYTSFTNDGFGSKTGQSVSIGTKLDSDRAHEISLEVGYVDWDSTRPIGPAGGGPSFADRATGHLTPVLGDYRFYFSATNALRLYVGGSAGLTRVSGSFDRRLSGVAYQADIGKWKPSFGALAGVSYSLTENVSLDLGYRYFSVSGFDFQTKFIGSTTAGPTVHFDALKANQVLFSASVSF